jgi:hypothetical protein
VDVEAGWDLSRLFLLGYFEGVAAGGYTPGAYLNPLSPSHAAAWKAARSQYAHPAYIYSSEPEPYALWDVVQPAWYDFRQTLLGPDHGADVILWQYGEGELGGLVDLDVATDLGYSLLKPPTPIHPAFYSALGAVGLKEFPNHVCPDALGPDGEGVTLKVGQTLTPTGRRTPHWLEVKLPGSPVHGWVEFTHVQFHEPR